jgi:enoyl-CoA hydratase/carnithine racemase
MSPGTQSSPAVTIDRPTDLLAEDRGGIRILSLARGKANALSTKFAHALHEAIRTTVGEQALTHWALLGETMSFEEARALGAIDRIDPAERLVGEAVDFARRLGGASSEVYAAIKRDLRGSAYERALDIQPDARKAFVESWFSETGQRGLDRALAH